MRIGWLLRACRTRSPENRYATLAAFADRLATVTTRQVSVSTLSRWENGATAIPQWAVAAYETVLGLEPGLLSATSDTVFRYHIPPTAQPLHWIRQRGPTAGEPLDELTERAVRGGLMTSERWDRLSDLIGRRPGLVFVPSSTWEHIASRLLLETAIADGAQWMVRAEAYHRLITHPVGQTHAIGVAAEAAADSSAQSMIGAMAVFSASRAPAAGSVVLRHVRDPVTTRTFYGALLTSAKKLRHREFSFAQLNILLPVLLELLRGDAEEVALSARLLQLFPPQVRAGLPRRVRPIMDAIPGLTLRGSARRLAEQTRHEAEGWSDALAEDPVLVRLIDEMLGDPVFDIRLCATFVLYSSPYREPLARAARNRLASAGNGEARRLLESLRILGGPDERTFVEKLLGRDGPADDITDMAAYTLGHIGGRSSDDFYLRTMRTRLDEWRRTGTAIDISVIDRLVYACGIANQRQPLTAVASDPDVPAPARTAVTWWLSLPPTLKESAVR
jgi:hypothetical protein